MEVQKNMLVLALLTGAAYGVGYYTAPTKVRVETKIQEVEKKTDTVTKDLDRDKHKETLVIERINPDGSKEVTTKITEDTKSTIKTDTITTSTISKDTTETKETIKKGPTVSIEALGGYNPESRTVVYGAHVSKEILGPITAGVFFLTPTTFGLSLGVNF